MPAGSRQLPRLITTLLITVLSVMACRSKTNVPQCELVDIDTSISAVAA